MEVYKIVYEEDKDTGVYALSLVGNPAMEDLWLTLSEQKEEINLEAVDDDKHLLLGAVLIPDKKIYRKVDGKEFFIEFGKETIEKLAHDFLKKGNHKNATENHDVKLDGMTVVEMWVVEDSDKDKSSVFGKKYVPGTWVAMMKVDDKDVWEKAKSGELKGFSIEALLNTRLVNFKKDNEMSENFLSRIEEKFEGFLSRLTPKSDVKMATVTLKDGKTKMEFEGDRPEIGTAIFVLGEEGQKIPAPEGVHELDNGKTISVDKNGLISVEEKEGESKETEQKLEAMIEAKLEKLKADYDKKTKEKDDKIKSLEAKLEATPAEGKITKTEDDKRTNISLSVEGGTVRERLLNHMEAVRG